MATDEEREYLDFEEEKWVDRVLQYSDGLDNQEALIEFVRLRFEAGIADPTAEDEYMHWVDNSVAEYYG